MVWTVHNNLRGDFRTAFADALGPGLMTLLRERLQPLQDGLKETRTIQDALHMALKSEFRQCHRAIQALRTNDSGSRQLLDE
jgi:hypothetical protein